jgi:hypothetical protein
MGFPALSAPNDIELAKISVDVGAVPGHKTGTSTNSVATLFYLLFTI